MAKDRRLAADLCRSLHAGESLSQAVHHALGGRRSMAQEFGEKDLSLNFRGSGNSDPDSDNYMAMAGAVLAQWKLKDKGLVEGLASSSFPERRKMPSRAQITRHDCVEGRSAIGKWPGVSLAQLTRYSQSRTRASWYFISLTPSTVRSSIDMDDARHAQTILAHGLNGADLPITNGAPLQLHVERQLGYKQAKCVLQLELVEHFRQIGGGNGGYGKIRATTVRGS